MKMFVTGGSGFLGGFLLSEATSAGYQVLALARDDRAASLVAERGATPVLGNLGDTASLDRAFQYASDSGANFLMNLASLGSGHSPALVSAAKSAGINRTVFVSTTAVTTSLPAPSRRVRLAAEEEIRASSLDWTLVRPTMIYGGPGDRNIARLLASLRRFPLLPLPGGGNRLQQPVHAGDLANALLAAMTTDAASGKVYNVAGPEPLTLRQLVEESAAAVNVHPRLLKVPLSPTIWATRVYQNVSSHPRIRAEQLHRLAEDKMFDITEAQVDLGYHPRSFQEGVTEEARELWG